MRKIIALVMLLIASACYASSTDENFRSANRGGIFHPDKSGDQELQSLIKEYAPKFTHSEYIDDSGMKLPFAVYVPENYSADKKFPVVFFIADGSSAGKDVNFSLTQGLGGLIWCKHDCVVIVPAYSEIVLDDHNGFTESPYLELTARFVKWAVKNYPVDTSRIYATGQSMGCMTWLVLAAKYTDMFTACMFVSGQWDINALKGLLTQKFVYVASAGDPKASVGMNEVIDMFRNDSSKNFIVEKGVNAKAPGLSFMRWHPVYFIMFRKGSTLPNDTDGNFSEHMTSFDYAYRIEAIREWLLAQKKETK